MAIVKEKEKRGETMAIDDQLIDELLKDYKKPEDLVGETGLLKELTKRLVERALNAEMTDYLGYRKNAPEGRNGSNSRNGHSKKTIQGEFGQAEISVPRDRESGFEPQLIQKGQRRFEGFDQKIVSLYARGMTTRDIQSHLEEIYGTEVSPTLISNVTAAVSEDVKLWQSRPLEAVYPIVYFDALWVKSRDEGHIRNKAVYLALGVNIEGQKEVLGLWIARTEGAKFWLQVLTELRNRGVQDIFIACVDGLKGFPEAIESQFPQTEIQLCIVHLVRNSLKYVNWKERKVVAAGLKAIYSSSVVQEAEVALEQFGKKWDEKYPIISRSWRSNWENIVTFFAYPQDIRKAIYTTNAIESLNHSLRKVIKNRGAFPDDESILKILYLALQNVARKWTMPIRNWKAALNHFAILFPERMPV
jgi:putative transposase